MRLVWVAPPDPTGATLGAALAELRRRGAEVEPWRPDEPGALSAGVGGDPPASLDAPPPGRMGERPAGWAELNRADAVVHHLGLDAAFDAALAPLRRRHPGILVLHAPLRAPLRAPPGATGEALGESLGVLVGDPDARRALAAALPCPVLLAPAPPAGPAAAFADALLALVAGAARERAALVLRRLERRCREEVASWAPSGLSSPRDALAAVREDHLAALDDIERRLLRLFVGA